MLQNLKTLIKKQEDLITNQTLIIDNQEKQIKIYDQLTKLQETQINKLQETVKKLEILNQLERNYRISSDKKEGNDKK